MQERIVKRYSACFKQQVVRDLESGRFGSIGEAQRHYGIRGATTVKRWLEQLGSNHLQAKVVRVEKVGEADRMRDLKRRVVELERALGRTQARNVLNETYLELACEQLGQEVEVFKKKSDGKRSTAPMSKGGSR